MMMMMMMMMTVLMTVLIGRELVTSPHPVTLILVAKAVLFGTLPS